MQFEMTWVLGFFFIGQVYIGNTTAYLSITDLDLTKAEAVCNHGVNVLQ